MKNRILSALILFSLGAWVLGRDLSYRVVDLGGLLPGGESCAQSINQEGAVVGYWNTKTNGYHGFLYREGQMMDLGNLGFNHGYALSINDKGELAGFLSSSERAHAFIYGRSGIVPLVMADGSASYAYCINGEGQLAGAVSSADSRLVAAMFDGQKFIELGGLGGNWGVAYGINTNQQIVGSASLNGNRETNGFLWQNGLLYNFQQIIPPNEGWEIQVAKGINESGSVIGWGLKNGRESAFFYKSGTIKEMGALPGATNSFAFGLNNKDVVVGASWMAGNGGTRACIWEKGLIQDLNDSLPVEAGWVLGEAAGINDEGAVVGWGEHAGKTSAFLMVRTLKGGSETNSPSVVQQLMRQGVIHALANVPPTVSITSPTNNSTFATPTHLTLAATAADSDGSITQVQFYASGWLVGTTTSTPYSMIWSNAPAGVYSLTARAWDDSGSVATSSVVAISITTNLSPTADAHVKDGTYTNSNFGASTVMEARTSSTNGGNRDIYFKFDLAGISNISNVKLKLFTSLSATGTIAATIYSVTNTSWTETGITWSNKPTRVAAKTTNTVSGTNGGWTVFDVSSYVISEKAAGRSVVSLALHNPTNVTQVVSVNSKENGSNQPVLLVLTTNALPTVSLTNPTNNTLFVAPAQIALSANASDDAGISKVEFFQGANSVGSTLAPPFSMVWSNVPAGSNALTARATDIYGLVATSAVVNVIVDAPPLVTLTNPINNAVLRATSNIVLRASATDSDGTVTQVVYYQGLSKLGTSTVSPYSVTWSNVPAGAYALTAQAKDNRGVASTSAVVNISVDIPPTVSIISPTTNANISGPTNLVLLASAADADGSVSQVEFFQGSNSLGLATSSPYTLTWSNAPLGNYALTAVARDNLGLFTTSSVVNVSVVALPAVDSLRLWLKADAITGVTNNGGIATWPDSSGYGNKATQSSSGNKPTYQTNLVNGKPAVRFDGTNDYFSLPSALMSGFTQAEFFVVLRAKTNMPTQSKNSWTLSTSTGYYPGSLGQIRDFFCYGDLVEFMPPSQVITQFHLFNVQSAPAQWSAHINGLLMARKQPGTFSTTTAPRLGAASSSFDGEISEVIIYNRVLTGQERSVVGSYLAQKYAFVGIPDAPTELAADPMSASQIQLSWAINPIPAGISCVVERSVNGGEYQSIATVYGDNWYLDSGLSASTHYTYRIKGATYGGTSTYSAAVSATTFDSGFSIPIGAADVWYQGETLKGTTNGAAIESWLDISGGGRDAYRDPYHLQAGPAYLTNLFHGRSGLRFVGGTTIPLFLPAYSGTIEESEMFAVLKAASRTPDSPNGSWRLGGSPMPWYDATTFYPGTDGAIAEDFGSKTVHNIGVPAQPLDQYHFVNFCGANNEWSARINGVLIASTLTNTYGHTGPSGTGLQRKLGYGLNAAFSGDILEFVIFNRRLFPEERYSMERYLNEKYAFVTNVPPVPLNLSAVGLSTSQISLHWEGDSDGIPTYYIIQRKAYGADVYQEVNILKDATTYCDSGLTAGETYTYRVQARNLKGDSEWSAEISAATRSRGALIPLADLGLWLNAEAIPAMPNGAALAIWPDWSGKLHDARQTNLFNQPVYVAGTASDKPSVRFDNGSQAMCLDAFMAGWNQAELFAVLKTGTNNSGQSGQPWKFGAALENPAYPDGSGFIQDDFGSVTMHVINPNTTLSPRRLYNISAGNNYWAAWLNGQPLYRNTTNVFGASTTPVLGALAGSLAGEISELLIFKRKLSAEERDSVAGYLSDKYLLTTNSSVPTNLRATPVAGTQMILEWNAALVGVSTVYQIERREGLTGVFRVVGNVRDSTSYVDSGLDAGVLYGYRVCSVTFAGPSEFSNEAQAQITAAGAALPLADLRLWLKADAGIISGPGGVAAWCDQSAQGNDAVQSDGAACPSWISAAINQRPAIRFDGTNDYFSLPNFQSGLSGAEMFAVLKARESHPSATRSAWHFGWASWSRIPLYPNTDGTIFEDFASDDLHQVPAPVPPVDQFHLYNAAGDMQSWSCRINGGLLVAAQANNFSAYPTPCLGLAVDYYNATASYFDGDISEVMVFNRVLTEAERDSLNGYFNARYQLVTNAPQPSAFIHAEPLSAHQTLVTWAPVYGATQFFVERAEGTNDSFQRIATLSNELKFLDSGLNPQTLYTYRIKAVSLGGISDPSATASIETFPEGNDFPAAAARLWLNASAQDWTNAQPISQWCSLAQGANHATQSGAANQPVCVTNAVNGLRAVRFDGANDCLNLPNFLSGLGQAELFAVVRAQTTNPANASVAWQLGPSGCQYPGPDGLVREDFGAAEAREISRGFGTLDKYHIYNVSAASDAWKCRFNGMGVRTESTNLCTFSTAPTLGSMTASWAGEVAEFIVFDRVLSASERAAVSVYLNQKYQIVTQPPAVPSGLAAATTNDCSASLTWNLPDANVSLYILQRKIGTNGVFQPVAYFPDGDVNGFVDSPVPSLVDGYYRLDAYSLAGLFNSSSESPSFLDSDGDGLNDSLEATLGTNPYLQDTDGDGMPDGWEVKYALNPLSAQGSDGANGDPDHDGISNLDEYLQGANPWQISDPLKSSLGLRVFTPLEN